MEEELLTSLINFIRTSYSPLEKIKHEKDGGETIFFKKAGKSLCYVETKEGKPRVTVVIGESLSDKVLVADISKGAKEKFTNAKQFHDGKWLFFDLKTGQDVEDIKTLLLIKRAIAKK